MAIAGHDKRWSARPRVERFIDVPACAAAYFAE
jgi:hypothetical protein